MGGNLVAAVHSWGADTLAPLHGDPQDATVGSPAYRPYTTPKLVAAAHRAGIAVIQLRANQRFPDWRSVVPCSTD